MRHARGGTYISIRRNAFAIAIAVDWPAVLVGTVGYQLLGALWYGPLFGSLWMDAMGYESHEEMGYESHEEMGGESHEEMGGESHEEMGGDSPTAGYAMTTGGSLVAAVALAALVGQVGASTWQARLGLGALAGVGFVATTGLQSVPFEGRNPRVYAINTGYNVVALAGLGVLLAVW